MYENILGAIVGDIIVNDPKPFQKLLSCGDTEIDSKILTITGNSVNTVGLAFWLMKDSGNSREVLCRSLDELMNMNPDIFRSGYDGLRIAKMVSPIGFYAPTLNEAIRLSVCVGRALMASDKETKGATAIAATIWMAKNQINKEEIRDFLTVCFNYNPHCKNTENTEYAINMSIKAFLGGDSFEEVLNSALSCRKYPQDIAYLDIAYLACSIASALYPIPKPIAERCIVALPPHLKRIMNRFLKNFRVTQFVPTQKKMEEK